MAHGTRSTAARLLALGLLGSGGLGCYAPGPADDRGVYAGPGLPATDLGDEAGDELGDAPGKGDGVPSGDAPDVGAFDGAIQGPGTGAAMSMDAGADAPAAAGSAFPRPTQLIVSVTTTSLRGPYAPRNVGAIWVESASGAHVKTLARWADQRRSYLTVYLEVTGGDATDAVTSATLRHHTSHTVRWDLTDRRGNPVPDGEYAVRLQLSEGKAPGAVARVAFTKGKESFSLMPPNQSGFSALRLRFE